MIDKAPRRKYCWGTCAMLFPSIEIEPPDSSVSRKRLLTIDDLPAPVRPIIYGDVFATANVQVDAFQGFWEA